MRSKAISIVAALLLVCGGLAGHAVAQSSPPLPEQEEAYNLALKAYGENRFTDARTLFESVRGAHADEAQKYLANIKKYREAIQEANGVVSRSANELDAQSVEFAISRYQEAMAIKKDGPWDPAGHIEKAKALQAQLTLQDGNGTATRDKSFCEKALAAARAHRYKEAALFSCPLANDDPGYSCGGDEAVHMCQQMGDLAKMPAPPEGNEGSEKAPGSKLESAKTAYEKNDFEDARSLLAAADEPDKASAADYLERISRFTSSMQQGETARRESRYDDARLAYEQAATIKPDGPGNPRQQAALIDLRLGIERFYAGEYVQAGQYLDAYEQESSEKRELVYFYRGASQLGRFFLAGAKDKTLREKALNDFRLAKKAGFAANAQLISPKILQVYDEVPLSP